MICFTMDNGPVFIPCISISMASDPEQGNEKSHLSSVASKCWLLASKAEVFNLQWPMGHSSVHGS